VRGFASASSRASGATTASPPATAPVARAAATSSRAAAASNGTEGREELSHPEREGPDARHRARGDRPEGLQARNCSLAILDGPQGACHLAVTAGG
jgi:hypothetical protein